ncbi:MAG: hypothetical protein ABI630_10990 [Betaproteobacteria bacterium]
MKRNMASAALLTAAALLAGCNGNLGFQFGNAGKSATAPSVGPGGSFSSSGVGVRFADAPGSTSIIGALGLGWLFGRDSGAEVQVRTPPLDTSRRVNEQDCTRPVERGENLRCN